MIFYSFSNYYVAKAKRQLQMSPASIGGEMIPVAIMPRPN